jgi:hypothetical protein
MSKIKEASLAKEDESNALTVAEARLPAAASDGWDEVPESSGSLIVGSRIKFDFNNRCWLIDDAKVEPDALDDTYVVIGVKSAWLKWGPDKRPEQRVTEPGQRHPERNDLPDNNEDEWPLGLDREPEDPWKNVRYVYFISKETAAEHTFVTDTFGGRRTVADLKQQIANARRVRPGAVPVVKLSIATMPTRFGPKPRPALKVVGWHGGPELVPAGEPKQLDQQVQRFSPDRIETAPQRMKADAVDNEPPPITEIDRHDDDEDIPF